MHEKLILIADDERMIRQALARVLAKAGLAVLTASDGAEAMEILTRGRVDAALLDIRMPGLEGMEVLARARRISPDLRVILMTAFGTVEGAVEGLKLGACDYVTKPLDLDAVVQKMQRLLETPRLAAEDQPRSRDKDGRDLFEGIVGSSAGLLRALEMSRRLAQTSSSALITGESGTGKELLARAIHANSPAAGGPLVVVHCAALPEALVESELFGYCRGAFSGANQDKPGLLARSSGGTLLLDEVSAMPLQAQAKLLRFLETRQWTPIGGTRAIDLEARVLCAVNCDIEREVREGRFRKDLYYRLNPVEIHLPPLRERREDIPALVDHFLALSSRELNMPAPGVSPGAVAAMLEYAWPGNIRELRNAMGRAMILGDGGEVRPQDLSFAPPGAAERLTDSADLRSALRSFQKMHILRVLRGSKSDKVAAAKALGIGLSSLYRKLEELGISDADGFGEFAGPAPATAGARSSTQALS
jgi:DNA-binding NtrC family response regulator